jgi:hypothetical protein
VPFFRSTRAFAELQTVIDALGNAGATTSTTRRPAQDCGSTEPECKLWPGPAQAM